MKSLFFAFIILLIEFGTQVNGQVDCYAYAIDTEFYPSINCPLLYRCCGNCTYRFCCSYFSTLPGLNQDVCTNSILSTKPSANLKTTTRNYTAAATNYPAIVFSIIGSTIGVFCLCLVFGILRKKIQSIGGIQPEQDRPHQTTNTNHFDQGKPPSYSEVTTTTSDVVNIQSAKNGIVKYWQNSKEEELPPYPGVV